MQILGESVACMHITRSQFKRLRHLLPRPRGSRRISHYRLLNALAYMTTNGCKWCCLPARFGPWHTVSCVWAHSGVLNEVLSHLQQDRLNRWCVQALNLDSTIIKVHPDGCGARKKRPPSHRQEP